MRFILFKITILVISGCSIHFQFETEYAAQSGSGEISTEQASEAKTGQSPTVDVKAELPEGI